MRASVNEAWSPVAGGVVAGTIASTCSQDWYEQALLADAPRRGPAASWNEDEESDEETPDVEDDDVPDRDDVQSDPFDDFDPEDFDDEFDDDFEEELEDEYEIEPEDDDALEDIESPTIKIDDGSADEEVEEVDVEELEDLDE